MADFYSGQLRHLQRSHKDLTRAVDRLSNTTWHYDVQGIRIEKEISRTVNISKTFPIGIGGLAFVVINSSPGHDLRATVTLNEEPEKLSLRKTRSRHAIELHEHLEFRFPWGTYVWFECREIVEIDSGVGQLC
jgi:hypothetical protein